MMKMKENSFYWVVPIWWATYNKNKVEEMTIGMFDGTHLKICGDDIPQDLKDYEIIEEIIFKDEVK